MNTDPTPPQPAPKPESDEWFEALGDEIEKHPIAGPPKPQPAPDRHEASRQAFEACYEPHALLRTHIPNSIRVPYRDHVIEQRWRDWCRALDHAASFDSYNDAIERWKTVRNLERKLSAARERRLEAALTENERWEQICCDQLSKITGLIDQLAAAQAEAGKYREAIIDADRELTNLQPHIPQACIPGHAPFIDTYVDAAQKVLRAALTPK